MYFIVMIPLRLGFFGLSNDAAEEFDFLIVDYCIDCFFVFDTLNRAMFFSNDVASTGSLNELESEFRKRTQIGVSFEQIQSNGDKSLFECEIVSRKAYRGGGRIILDLLSNLPLELLVTFGVLDGSYLWWLRLPHLIRIHRFFPYINHIESYLYHHRVRISADVIQLLKVCLVYVLVNHLYANVWMWIHRYHEKNVAATWAVNDKISRWDAITGEHDVCTDGNVQRCYVRAFHFVITTISSVGYGDIYPATQTETMFELLVVISGACLVSCLIGSFAALFQGHDNSGLSAFKQKLHVIEVYCDYKRIKLGLKQKIMNHHRHLYNQQKTLDVGTVMQDLPVPLQMEIAMYVGRAKPAERARSCERKRGAKRR